MTEERPNAADYANKAERDAAYAAEQRGLLVRVAMSGKGYMLCYADGEPLPCQIRCVVDAEASGATVTVTFHCLGDEVQFAA